jgi:hypothetical protein
MNDEPRMVSASVFAAWWKKITQLWPESLNDKTLEALCGALRVIGLKAGVIHAQNSGFQIDPDWQGEEIEFNIEPQLFLEWWGRYEPETLIATLITVTGISE